jgi:predicted DNA-binding transcriptional regulator AlpA
MSEVQLVAKRVQRIRRELDECGEQLERLSRDLDGVEVDDKLSLVGLTEITEMTGASYTNVKAWHRRGQLPDPVAVLACGPIWQTREIKRWMKRRAA